MSRAAMRRASALCVRTTQSACAAYAKWRLRNQKFTIVSNNCWGAHIYRALSRPYTTPFVGLFIPPEDYLRLVPNVDSWVHADIAFIPSSRYRELENFRAERKADYPIGLLDGKIELHFMHYRSAEEAASKWRRRTSRASWDSKSVFFKFCDHDGASEDQIRCFDNMANLSRVCFTGRKYDWTSRCVYVAGCAESRVPDGGELAKVSGKYFSAVDWIKGSVEGGMRPWLGNHL
jgi:uncharacterized protein (DUF1919 family)